MSKFKLLDLNYVTDLAVHYKKLSNLPGFVLLESLSGSSGRYDILSAYPYEKIQLTSSSFDSNKIFSALSEKLPYCDYDVDLPFQGGAIGFFSYDFACALANIPFQPQKELRAFPLVEIGFYDWAIITDHLLKKISLFCANTRADTAAIVEEILVRWNTPCLDRASFQLQSAFIPQMSKEAYKERFFTIHNELKRGRCYQVNFTQPFIAQYKGDLWTMYEQIKNRNAVPHAAFMKLNEGAILSFSPERFLKIDKKRVLVSPIKGTAPRGASPEEDEQLYQALQASLKNRAENTMIVDLLRNDLSKVATPWSVRVEALCNIERFKTVQHLVSHIRAERREDVSSFDVFKACFPSGSITGAPKLEAMRVISEQEIASRGIYCGSMGYFSFHGHADSNIAIRTLIATEGSLHLAAGGGIVIDSQWEEEYQECLIKLAGIINALK